MSSVFLNSNDEKAIKYVKTDEIVNEETDEQNVVEFLQPEVTAAETECPHNRPLVDEQVEEQESTEYFDEEECDEDEEDEGLEDYDEETVEEYGDDDNDQVTTGLTLNEEEALTGTEENTEDRDCKIKQEFVEPREEVKIIETKLDENIELIINEELTQPEFSQDSTTEIKRAKGKETAIAEKPPKRTRVPKDCVLYSTSETDQLLKTAIEICSIKKSTRKQMKPTSTDKKPNKNLSSKPTLKSQKSTKVDLSTSKLNPPNPRTNSQSKSKPKIPLKSHYNFDSLLSSSQSSSINGILGVSARGKKSEPEPFKGSKSRSKSIDNNKPTTTKSNNNNNNNNKNNKNNNNGSGTANGGKSKSKNSLQKRNSQTKSLYHQEQQRAKITKGEWMTRDTLLLRAKDELVSVVPPTQGSWGFNASALWFDGHPATSGEHYWTVQFGSIGTSDFFAGGRCGVSSRDRMKALKARGLLYGGNVSGHGELTNGSKVLVNRFGRAVKSNDRIGILVSFFEEYDEYDPLGLPPQPISANVKGKTGSGPGSRIGSKVTSKSLLTSGESSGSDSTTQYKEDPIQGQRRLSVYFYHNGRCLGLGFRVPASLFPSGVYPMVQFNVENGSARIWKEPKGNIPPLSNRSPVPIKHRGIEGYWKTVGGAIKGADEELARKFNQVLKRGRMVIDELNFPNNNNNNSSSSTTSKTKDKNREYKISVLLQKYRIIFFARKSVSAWTWTFSGYPLGRNGKSEGKTLKKVFKFPESVNLEPHPNGEKMSVVKGKFTINFVRKDFTPFIGNSFREHEAV